MTKTFFVRELRESLYSHVEKTFSHKIVTVQIMHLEIVQDYLEMRSINFNREAMFGE